MPNVKSIAVQVRAEGILKVDSFLASVCFARRLVEEEVQAYAGRCLTDGWEMTIETASTVRRLRVLIDAQFPFSLPHFFLVDRPSFLTWPHIEQDGLLCLLGFKPREIRQVNIGPRSWARFCWRFCVAATHVACCGFRLLGQRHFCDA